MDKINKEILEETLREHPEFKKFHDKRIEEFLEEFIPMIHKIKA
jgi:hypothetical protein